MSQRKATSKKRNKRLGRKAFRAACRTAMRGGHLRPPRNQSYYAPSSLRGDKLPLL